MADGTSLFGTPAAVDVNYVGSLALTPERDDEHLGTDRSRNNTFAFADDPLGLKTPTGCHVAAGASPAMQTSPAFHGYIG